MVTSSHEIKRHLLLGRKWKWSHSVMSDFLQLHGMEPTRLLHPWNFPVKSTGVGCHFLGRKAMTNLDNVLKSRDIALPTKIHLVKAMAFPLVMYGCESWTIWTIKVAEHWRLDASKLCCWRRLLRVPWTARRSNQSILTEINQPWIFIGRTDAPILWPSDARSQLTWKNPDARKDWGQKKGVTVDDMVGWHHQLNGHEFEQTPGTSQRQGSLACHSPRGCKESDRT